MGAGNQSGKVQGAVQQLPRRRPAADRRTSIATRRAAWDLPLREVTDALQVFLGSSYVNDFDFNNRAYRVYVQADQRFRAEPDGPEAALRARERTGRWCRSTRVVRLRETTAPQVISHFNLFRSAEITGNPAPGQSSGQALQAMEELARQNLPPGFDFAWAGQSLEEIKAGSQAGLIFGLSGDPRLPGAGGAVRELGAAVHHPARRAARGVRRALRAAAARASPTTCSARSAWSCSSASRRRTRS